MSVMEASNAEEDLSISQESLDIRPLEISNSQLEESTKSDGVHSENVSDMVISAMLRI